MRQMRWTVSVHREGGGQSVPLATFTRPVDGAKVADFGLSLEEGRHICSKFCRRPSSRVRSAPTTAPCDVAVIAERTDGSRIGADVSSPRAWVKCESACPGFVSCLCTPEPLDDDGVPMDRQRLSECPIHRLIPDRRTPELSYLCAKHGASHPYRIAAGIVSEVTGLRRLCHMTVLSARHAELRSAARRRTVPCRLVRRSTAAAWPRSATACGHRRHLPDRSPRGGSHQVRSGRRTRRA